MKLETFIKNEVRKYREVVKRAIKNNKVNLDVLEQKKNQYYRNCESKIWDEYSNLAYSQFCSLKDMAQDMLENVDEEFFGIHVNGTCVGYDFFRYNK